MCTCGYGVGFLVWDLVIPVVAIGRVWDLECPALPCLGCMR